MGFLRQAGCRPQHLPSRARQILKIHSKYRQFERKRRSCRTISCQKGGADGKGVLLGGI